MKLISMRHSILARITLFGLMLFAFNSNAVTFSWMHDGLSTDISVPVPVEQLSFQIEYSVEGGPNQYIDVPIGIMPIANERVFYEDINISILCQQTIVARVKAIYHGNESAWSAQATETAAACPTPGNPVDVNIDFP